MRGKTRCVKAGGSSTAWQFRPFCHVAASSCLYGDPMPTIFSLSSTSDAPLRASRNQRVCAVSLASKASLLTMGLLVFIGLQPLVAQNPVNPFGITMPLRSPLNNQLLGTGIVRALDTSDYLHVQDGHIVRANGERARLIGTTLSYQSCFPDSAQAIALAQRFHDLGMNCVRFRGWDTYYLTSTPYATSDTTFSEFYQLRFDWFIAQLSARGIQVLLSQTGLTPKSGDGVRQYDSIKYNWQTRVFQFVDADYQSFQRKFLRRFFRHVNPYTNREYRNEPALALYTATDENSLNYYWVQNFIENSVPILPQTQRYELDSLFAAYLKQKYSTVNDNVIAAAWSDGPTDTTNRFLDPGFEDLFTSPWQTNINTNNAQAAYTTSDADKVEGSRSAVFKVLKGGVNLNDIQLTLRGIKVEKGKQYTFTVWMKSSTAGHKVQAYLLRGSTPYTGYGLNSMFTLTNSWQMYSTTFRSNSADDNALLLLQLGGTTSDVYFDNSSFRESAAPALMPGESLGSNTIDVAIERSNVSTKRILETGAFINVLQERYYESLRSFLRDSLECHLLCGGSSWCQYLGDVYTERNLDFSSMNGYRGSWAVQGTGSPWNNHWSFANSLNVEDRYGSTIGGITRAKIRNKPLCITDEMQIYPSPHLNDLISFVPAYAQFQDADMIILGDWNGSGSASDLDSSWIKLDQIWEIKGQYALQSLFPSVSAAWKNALVAPAEEAIPFLLDAADQRMAFFRRVEIDSFDAVQQSVLPHLVIPEFNGANGLDMSNIQSDTKELLWNQSAGWLHINTPRYVMASGRLKSGIHSFDGLTIEQTDNSSYATVSWLSLDSNAIADAPKSLITLSTKAHNRGAVIEGDTSLWQGWGSGSVQTQSCTMRFSLRSDFDSLSIQPLDSLGYPSGDRIEATKSVSGKFSFELDQSKTHALWFAVEQHTFASDVPWAQTETNIRCYPDPVRTVLHCSLSDAAFQNGLSVENLADIRIVDVLGHSVDVDIHRGNRSIDVDCHSLADGLYMIRMSANTRVVAMSFVVAHESR